MSDSVQKEKRRVLIGCYEVSGFGGANTASYELFRKMQNDGHQVAFVNLIKEADAVYLSYVYGEDMGNPDRLPDVYTIVISPSPQHPNADLTELNNLINQFSPDAILGVGFIATLTLGRATPERPLAFLMVGCDIAYSALDSGYAKDLIEVQAKVAEANGRIPVSHRDEREALQSSDLLIPTADFMRDVYRLVYPGFAGKVCLSTAWAVEWIAAPARKYAKKARPFKERKIDVLFVASFWSRNVKNYGMVCRIIRACSDLNIHIVGQATPELDAATYHGFISSREELFGLMGEAKVLVSTSLIDVAPGVLYEASIMGCNVIASKNCGNWKLCNSELLVDPYSLDGYVGAIRQAVNQKKNDNISWFENLQSYHDLVETLEVL